MSQVVKKRRSKKITEDPVPKTPPQVVAEYHVLDPKLQEINDAPPQEDNESSRKHVILKIKQLSEDPKNGFSSFFNDIQSIDDTAHTLPDEVKVVATLNQSNSCFWCSCPTPPHPIGIPIKFTTSNKPIFTVTGSFCCFECAAAFIFNSSELHINKWESYNLLNIMANMMNVAIPVKQAPSRFCLKQYGGWMDPTEFHQTHDCSFSPMPVIMVSSVQIMEESHNGPKKEPKGFIPLDNDRVMKAKQNLMKLQNTTSRKSIHDKMNLRTA